MKKIITTLAIFALTASFAQNGKPPRGGKGGTPPQEAIIACEGEETNATCTMETPRGDTLTGTCQNTPDKKYFVCMPDDHKEHQDRKKNMSE
ncbi:hypothetical protein KKC13_09435 [bacterium]|nr:hypothetical protein [bacterium]MBU1958078.1 hypothetical protein [bacterium]